MKRLVFILGLALFSASFADGFRILNTPRCIIDLDMSSNILDLSKCPIAHDQYYGDSTFSIAIVCNDSKGMVGEKQIKIYPGSLKETEGRESYLEITPRTNYSLSVDYAYKVIKDKRIVFSRDTFFGWIREGRVNSCTLVLGSPYNIMKIYK